MTVTDPDFTDDDRAAALEWKADDDSRCDGCGDRLSDTTKAHPQAYDAEIVTCRRCAVAEQAINAEKQAREDKRLRDGGRVRTWERPV